MNARFADLTLAEAARRLGRYRPLVVTLVLTLGILRALPDDATTVEGAQRAAAPATAPPRSRPVADGVSPPEPDPSIDVAPSSRPPRPTAAAPPAPRGSSAATARSSAMTLPSPSAPPPSTERPGSIAPAIVDTGWATRAAGTPAGTIGVPDDSLPVGNRLGQTDKASFLRLGGDWQRLTLPVDADGSAGVGDPAVLACAITSRSWEPRAGSGFEDAPTWGDDCVAGVAEPAGGRWSFDLEGVDHRFGVALVPAPDAPVEFQIAFRIPR